METIIIFLKNKRKKKKTNKQPSNNNKKTKQKTTTVKRTYLRVTKCVVLVLSKLILLVLEFLKDSYYRKTKSRTSL